MSRLVNLRKDEKGQAIVEFALIAIIIVALFLAMAQFGMILSAKVAVTNAAREGARAAAVGKEKNEILDVVVNSVSGHVFLDSSSSISVTVTGNTVGNPVKVVVNNARVTTIVPIPSTITGEANIVDSGTGFPINGEASMRLEKARVNP